MRTRLRDFADLTTVIQGLIVFSSAGFLAVFAQSLAKTFLGFSILERAILGVCLFLVVVAAVLAALKRIRDRRTAAEQERDELRETLLEVEQDLEDLRKENEELIGARSIGSPPSSPTAGLALYPSINDDELSEPVYTRRTVYIAEFARTVGTVRWRDAVINGRTFIECHIVGPAVLVDMNTGQVDAETFVDCGWDEGTDSSWMPSGISQKYTGIVGLEDCLFRGCRFTRVGKLLKPPEEPDMEDREGPRKLHSRTDDEALKGRCTELAEELTLFMDRWEAFRDAGEETDIFGGEHRDWPRQTMGLYRDEYEDKLVALLDDLEHREKLTSEARAHLGLPTNDPQKIREMAARLASIGHRL